MLPVILSFFLSSVLSGNLFLPTTNNQVSIEPVRNYTSRSIGVEVSAKAALVVDSKTDKILYTKNINSALPIASISKLMTALVLLDTNPDWQAEVIMQPSDEVYRAKYVYRGESWSVRDLFWTMLVGSDNNATIALVRSTGLSLPEFVERMNKKALALQMTNTVFFDPTGLTEKNTASAHDVWQMAKAAWQSDLIRQPTSQSNFYLTTSDQKTRRVVNTNLLFQSFLEVRAGKTGFIDEAGYCITTLLTNKDNHEVFLVVLGSATEDDRWQDAKALAWWTYNNWLWP